MKSETKVGTVLVGTKIRLPIELTRQNWFWASTIRVIASVLVHKYRILNKGYDSLC